jgi:hypothetical protein
MFTNKKTLLAMSVASVFALSGCSSDDDKNEVVPDPVDPPVVVVPPEAPAELGSVVNANIVDSESFDVVSSTVMFFESGVASANVVDENGEVVTSVTTEDGNFSFLLKDGADIDSVTAVVMADGYIQKTFSIDLTELSDGDVDVLLPLTSETATGVAVEETDAAVSGGSSADAITGGVANGKATAAVTVPGGTQLQDANGDLITGDSVTLSVTAADTSSSAGAAITPEGLNAGSTTTVKTPVGVASVEMVDSNGTKVKKFSQPITVSMAIPADKGVSTGDMLTLVSQNEDTGVWTTETQQVEVKDLIADGSFYNASFMTDHLTFFAATEENTVCSSDVTLGLGGSAVPASGLKVRLQSDDATTIRTLAASNASGTIISGTKAKDLGITDDATASVRVFDSEGYTWYQSTGEVAICGTIADVNLEQPDEVALVDQAFTIVGQCADDAEATVSASGSLVTYKRVKAEGDTSTPFTKKAAPSGVDAGEYALIDLISDATYNVSISYSGSLAFLNEVEGATTAEITADGADVTKTVTIADCSELTGSGS